MFQCECSHRCSDSTSCPGFWNQHWHYTRVRSNNPTTSLLSVLNNPTAQMYLVIDCQFLKCLEIVRLWYDFKKPSMFLPLHLQECRCVCEQRLSAAALPALREVWLRLWCQDPGWTGLLLCRSEVPVLQSPQEMDEPALFCPGNLWIEGRGGYALDTM